MPMLATQANGQPAYGLYMRTPAGDFAPFQLQVLELDGDRVRHVTAFFDLRAVRDVRSARPPARRLRARAGRSVRATLGGSVELLDRALAYTCAQLSTVEDDQLGRRTPCEAWTLADLLAHMEDALDAFTEAAGGSVAVTGSGCDASPVCAIQAKATGLLGVWSRPAPGDVVLEASAGRLDIQTPLLVTTAALEVTVHGWDVARTTGQDAPVPGRAGREPAPRRGVAGAPERPRGSVRRTPAGGSRCAVRPTPVGIPRSYLTGPPARSQAFRSPGGRRTS